MLLSAVIIAAGTMGSVQYVFARTVEFKLDMGVSANSDRSRTSARKGEIAGISYDKLVMANVEEAVNVRSEASENSELIGKFYKDCAGSIIERKSGWTRLKTGDLTGWVKDEYLLFGDDAAELAEKVVERTAISTTQTLRVRKEPSTDAGIYSLLAEGDKIEAVEEMGEWVKVAYSDGDIGYVASEYVKIEDSLDSGESIEVIKKREEAEAKAKAEAGSKKTSTGKSAGQVASTGAVNNGAISGDINDTQLLAALIQAEAGNQPYEGQVSVGTVVMNRLRTGKYGSSLYSVIFAKGQFGPAGSGQVASIYAAGPKASCMQAAQDAMSGTSYIGAATKFRNVSSGMPGIVIGNHVFW